jgi:DNA ligase 4
MTGAEPPISLSKVDLEKLVKENGGSIYQSEKAVKHLIVIADRSTASILSKLILDVIKVTTLVKRGTHNILRPRWILESVDMGFVLPLESRYISVERDSW